MPHQVIRIRDVARSGVYELGPDEEALRGPYDLFNPVGAVRLRGNLVEYLQGNVVHTARVVPSRLGEVHAGERVLVRLPPRGNADEWWLCDVQATDGIAVAE